jgi:predicted GIY-YIG superfamily endonuclease
MGSIEQVTSGGWVYRLFDGRGVLLYIGLTSDFGRRWKAHLRNKSWAAKVRSMTTVWYDDYEVAAQAEAVAIVAEYPLHNIAGVPAERLCVIGLTRALSRGMVPHDERMDAWLLILANALLGHLGEDAGTVLASVVPSPRSLSGEDSEFSQVITHLGDLGPGLDLNDMEDPPRRIDPRRTRIRSFLHVRGAPGYTVGRLVILLAGEGLICPRETVQRWLAADEADGLVKRTGKPLYRWVWASS